MAMQNARLPGKLLNPPQEGKRNSHLAFQQPVMNPEWCYVRPFPRRLAERQYGGIFPELIQFLGQPGDGIGWPRGWIVDALDDMRNSHAICVDEQQELALYSLRFLWGNGRSSWHGADTGDKDLQEN
jgi:hypothetical protein